MVCAVFTPLYPVVVIINSISTAVWTLRGEVTEENIEEAINKEVAELEVILGEKFRKECEWDEKCLPLVTSSEPLNENHFSPIPDKNTEPGTKETEIKEETYWSDEEEILESEEKEHWQNHFSPPGIICSTDRIYLTANETLVLPEDINGSTKEEE